MFGGANPKNMQVAKGGCAAHATAVACRTCQRRRRGRQRQPDPRRRTRSVAARMDRDQARYRHRDAAGARPYSDRRAACTIANFSPATARASSACRLCHGRERRPAQGCRLGGAITGIPAETIRALARRMAANRTMISASWSLQRADHGEQPYWARHPARIVPRPDRLAGRRLRLRLRLGDRHRRTATGVSRADAWKLRPIRSIAPSRRRASPSACCSPASLRFQRPQTSTYPGHQARLLGGRQSVSSSPGHQPTARRVPAAANHRRARAVVDGDRTPRRHRVAGDHHARAQRYRRRAARPLCDRDAKAIEPVGEARSDYTIFSRAGAARSAAKRITPRPRRNGLAAPPL